MRMVDHVLQLVEQYVTVPPLMGHLVPEQDIHFLITLLPLELVVELLLHQLVHVVV